MEARFRVSTRHAEVCWEVERRDLHERLYAMTQGCVSLLAAPEMRELHPVSPPPVLHAIEGPQDVTRVRAAVGAWLAALGVEEEARADAVLCVGEAATNVVKHACGGWLEMHVSATGRLQAWVVDDGPGIPLAVLPQCVLEAGWSSKDSAGQGFTLMRALAHRLLMSTGASGTTVVIELSAVLTEQPSVV